MKNQSTNEASGLQLSSPEQLRAAAQIVLTSFLNMELLPQKTVN